MIAHHWQLLLLGLRRSPRRSSCALYLLQLPHRRRDRRRRRLGGHARAPRARCTPLLGPGSLSHRVADRRAGGPRVPARRLGRPPAHRARGGPSLPRAARALARAGTRAADASRSSTRRRRCWRALLSAPVPARRASTGTTRSGRSRGPARRSGSSRPGSRRSPTGSSPLQGRPGEQGQDDALAASGATRATRTTSSSALTWVAYALIAVAAPWGWIACLRPALILYLILFVTGIPPAEEQALRSRGDDYRRYQRETSAFVPWFPKRSSTA